MSNPIRFSVDDKRTLVSVLAGSEIFKKHCGSLLVDALNGVLPEKEVMYHANKVHGMDADYILPYLGTISVPGDSKPAEMLFLETFMNEIGKKDPAYDTVMGVLRSYAPRPFLKPK